MERLEPNLCRIEGEETIIIHKASQFVSRTPKDKHESQTITWKEFLPQFRGPLSNLLGRLAKDTVNPPARARKLNRKERCIQTSEVSRHCLGLDRYRKVLRSFQTKKKKVSFIFSQRKIVICCGCRHYVK